MKESNVYKCGYDAGLNGVNGWTDEEAEKEASKNIPDWDQSDREVVCDDCYKLIMAANGIKIETDK